MEIIIVRLWFWLISKWDCLFVIECDVSLGFGVYNMDRLLLKEKNVFYYFMSFRIFFCCVDFIFFFNMYVLFFMIGFRVFDRKGGM